MVFDDSVFHKYKANVHIHANTFNREQRTNGIGNWNTDRFHTLS
jgi:hypothetical protein